MRAAYAMCPVNSKTHEEAVKYLTEHDDKFNAASQTKKATPHEDNDELTDGTSVAESTSVATTMVCNDQHNVDDESTDGTWVAESTTVATTVVYNDQHNVDDESTDGTWVAESMSVATTVVCDDQHEVESLDSNNKGRICRNTMYFAMGFTFGASCVMVIIIMM